MNGKLFRVVAMAALAGLPAAARAQSAATVREIVQVVKTGKPGSSALSSAHIGTTLASGDRVRTGGRSAAGLRFPDQSLLRLGELTEVVVTSANRRETRVVRGEVFANYRQPGTITGGYAVAAVRGTHIEYIVDEQNKTASVRCYKGRVFVGASDNPVYAGATDRVTLNTLTDPGLNNSTIPWQGGEVRFTDGPYEGEVREVTAFDPATGIVTFNPPLPAAAAGPGGPGVSGFLLVKQRRRAVIELLDNTGTTVHQGQDPDSPYRVPHEEFAGINRHPFFRNLVDGKAFYVYPGTDQHWQDREEYFGERRAIEQITERRATARHGICDIFGPGNGPGGNGPGNGPGANAPAHQFAAPGIGVASSRIPGLGGRLKPVFAQATSGPNALVAAQPEGPRLAAAPSTGASRGDGGLATGEYEYLPENARPSYDFTTGKNAQFRFEPFAFATNHDDTEGARIRFQGTTGDAYAEFGYRYALLNGKSTHEFSEGFLEFRGRNGDLTVGRQHLFLRAANNQDIGTLLGLETSDAIVYEPPLGDGYRLQSGYLLDSRSLDKGGFRGGFTRGQMPFLRGLAGFTVSGSQDEHPNLGWSLDTSQSLIPNVLDVYGEGGSDMTGRRIFTAGLYIPALYHMAKIDTFLEYGSREDIEDRFSLRLRREFGRNLLLVGFVDKRSKVESITVGGGILWSARFR
jgi:hypothetical protein